MGRRKNVRAMKRVLRAHGSPVPKTGCGGKLTLLALVLLAALTAAYTVIGAMAMRG